jgi:hypothetical protein
MRAVVLTQLLLFAVAHLIAAERNISDTGRLRFPGTSASFVPKIDLAPASGFAGFENVEHQLAILSVELPIPATGDALAELERVMTPANLRQQGVEFESAKRVVVEGGNGLLVKGHQTRHGMEFRKYLLFLPDKGKLAQVQISFLLVHDNLLQPKIVEMIQSVRFERQVAKSTTPYTLWLPEGWKLAKQFAVLEVYTPQGKFPVSASSSSIGIVNLSESVASERQAQFVLAKNRQRNHYSNLREISSENTQIDGQPANVSFVSAVDLNSNQPVILQYCYIFLPDTTYLIESRRGTEMSDRRFDGIARSWQLRRRDATSDQIAP